MYITYRRLSVFLLIICCSAIFVISCSPAGNTSDNTAVTARFPAISIGTTLYTYRGHHNGVTAVAWSPDGNYIASASLDVTVQVWATSTGNLLSIYHGHLDCVTAVAWSPDGKYIASTGFDNTVQVWQAFTGKSIWISCCRF